MAVPEVSDEGPHTLMRLPHPRWFGYRGTALMMFGFIYIFIGLAVLANPMPNPILLHTQLPVWLRILIWSGTGVFAVVAAIIHRRWPWTGHVGFGALFLGPAERALSYGFAMVREPSLNWLAATLIYLLLTGIVVLLSSWPEPLEEA